MRQILSMIRLSCSKCWLYNLKVKCMWKESVCRIPTMDTLVLHSYDGRTNFARHTNSVPALNLQRSKLFWSDRNSMETRSKRKQRDLHHDAKISPLGYRVQSVDWNFETENTVCVKNPSAEFLWWTTDYSCIPTMDRAPFSLDRHGNSITTICKNSKLLIWSDRNSVEQDRNANRDLHQEAKISPLGYRVQSLIIETLKLKMCVKNPSVAFQRWTNDPILRWSHRFRSIAMAIPFRQCAKIQSYSEEAEIRLN